MFDVQQEALTQSIADAEAQNRPLAAERLAKRAQKCVAEAVASRWTDKVVATAGAKGRWHTESGMADNNTIQFLPVVRIGVLGALGTHAADIRESARSGSSTGMQSHPNTGLQTREMRS